MLIFFTSSDDNIVLTTIWDAGQIYACQPITSILLSGPMSQWDKRRPLHNILAGLEGRQAETFPIGCF